MEHRGSASVAPSMACLDEALAAREWRRARRWLRTSSVPLLHVLGSVTLPWLVVPGIYAILGSWSGQARLQSQPRWMFMTLALTLVGGAMATAFSRVSHLWQTERIQRTLEGWFLSSQQPQPLVLTAALSGAALALLVSLPGLLLLLVTALLSRVTPIQSLLTLLLLITAALIAAAVAGAAFFASSVRGGGVTMPQSGHQAIRSSGHQLPNPALAFTAVFGLVLLTWLRIESVEHGWARPWEEHPARLFLAAGLWTPAPALIGLVDRGWWIHRVMDRLDLPVTPEQAAGLIILLYLLASLLLLRWSARAFQLLRVEPERDRSPNPADAGEGEATPSSARSYWAGFANPVWTRELRTRLRGREAPQFIFFASVALALGGFGPLVAAAGQIGDPLETARVAREVFFWLSITLLALIALIAPGLTAEAITAERTRGTLELLLATPMKRQAILRGKLLGDLSVLGLLISPSLPLFGFCYLFHGADAGQVAGVLLLLAITALICSLVGVTASAIHTRSLAAKWQAYLISLFLLGIGPTGLMFALVSEGGVMAPSTAVFMALVSLILSVFVLAVLWNHACERLQSVDDLVT